MTSEQNDLKNNELPIENSSNPDLNNPIKISIERQPESKKDKKEKKNIEVVQEN